MVYETVDEGGEVTPVASLVHPLVAMDGDAAGSGGKSSARHGRRGDGITFVIDITQTRRGGVSTGLPVTTNTPISRFFEQEAEPTFGRADGPKKGTFDSSAAARAAAAAAGAEEEGGSEAEAASLGTPAPNTAAPAAAASAAAELEPRCFHCGCDVDGTSQWYFAAADGDEANLEGIFKRFCNTCNLARISGRLGGGVRPAVAAGICGADGCPACIGPLPQRAKSARLAAQKRKGKKKSKWTHRKK